MSRVDIRLKILRSFQCATCPGCGGIKSARQTVCSKCWKRVSADVQGRLYSGFGYGYEQAFDAAMKELGAVPQFPDDARVRQVPGGAE